MIVSLEQIATISLGYKSLQNNFYYLNRATIDTFGIEDGFTHPISRLSDLSASAYHQDPEPQVWLFVCRSNEADLRGTGALRYIDAMAERPAQERKQSGRPATIREALSSQGGRIWYAPKASPVERVIWIRKAFNGVFAPFFFRQAALVDQRCNGVTPTGELTDEEVGAVLSSTLFAYSAEVNGSSNLGAGALEAATKAVRTFPVVDPGAMSKIDRAKLVELARNCWKEKPIDWSRSGGAVPAGMRELDGWLLQQLGSSIDVDRLYGDMAGVVRERLHVARDKTKTSKAKRTDSIGTVAQPIADRIKKRLGLRTVPDSFTTEDKLDLRVDLGGVQVHRMSLKPFVGEAELTFETKSGSVIYHAVLNSATAEMVCRGVLAGRNAFSVASDRKEANNASERLLTWLDDIATGIDEAVSSSSLGTGYEDILRREIFERVGVNASLFRRQLPETIVI